MSTETVAAPAATELGALTAADLASLRTADYVVFQMHQGRCAIRAGLRGGYAPDGLRIYRAREQRIFPDTESYGNDRERTIPVEFSMGGAGGDGESGWHYAPERTPSAVAFEMIHAAQYARAWQTVAASLRVGDVVRLVWAADAGSNQATRAVGIHVDELSVTVERNGKRNAATYVVETFAGPDSSARMIRRNG